MNIPNFVAPVGAVNVLPIGPGVYDPLDPAAGAGAVSAPGLAPITAEILSAALLPADQLASLEIPQRENFCGTWFRRGDLGFIFGARGLGKTFLGLELAAGLACGRNMGPWAVPAPRRVMYVDGEMPLDEIKARLGALGGLNGNLKVLNHERLFETGQRVLNLSSPAVQRAILEVCAAEKIEVLLLDNLSCLFSGVAENDADAWELVLPWLLELRRRKIAVIIIHHAGRAGWHMRGTTKREDAAFWIIQLGEPSEHTRDGEGAKFISRFSKKRQGTREETEPLLWHFAPDGERTRVTFARLRNEDIFRQWIVDGLNCCSDIAVEMGVSRGAISKMAKRAERDGWLLIEGRTYKLK